MFEEIREIERAIAGLIDGAKVAMIHSSLSAMGRVHGGPSAVVEAVARLAERGITVMMPALSYERVTPERPLFDLERTPSNVGVIPEAFRKSEGVIRSVHPTHSVCAFGPLAEAVTAEHAKDRTPVGERSPFRKLVEKDGVVIFIGCGLRPNTLMHGVEELVKPPYLFNGEVSYTIVTGKGSEYSASYLTHDFKGYVQRYDRIAEFLTKDEMIRGGVLKAECYALKAVPLWEKALKEIKKNELAFVDRTLEG